MEQIHRFCITFDELKRRASWVGGSGEPVITHGMERSVETGEVVSQDVFARGCAVGDGRGYFGVLGELGCPSNFASDVFNCSRRVDIDAEGECAS